MPKKNLFLGPYYWFIFCIWLISESHTRPDVLPGPYELFWTPIANQSEHRFLMIDHIDFMFDFGENILKNITQGIYFVQQLRKYLMRHISVSYFLFLI